MARAAHHRQPPQRLHSRSQGREDRAIGIVDRRPLFVGQPQCFGLPKVPENAAAGDARQPFRAAIPEAMRPAESKKTTASYMFSNNFASNSEPFFSPVGCEGTLFNSQ